MTDVETLTAERDKLAAQLADLQGKRRTIDARMLPIADRLNKANRALERATRTPHMRRDLSTSVSHLQRLGPPDTRRLVNVSTPTNITYHSDGAA